MPKRGGALSAWETASLESGFDLIDHKCQGTIDFDELVGALQVLNFGYSNQDVHDMIRIADPHHSSNGQITKNKYMQLYSKKTNQESQEDIDEAFNRLNEGNELTGSDLQRIFDAFHIECTEEEIQELIKIGDLDGDGYIGLEDFRNMCNADELTFED